jgi:hypothetical protein
VVILQERKEHKMMKTVMAFVLVLVLVGMVQARSVFLNGVKIDRLKSQTFEKCKVTIDENGNVHIHAPGYSVRDPGANKLKAENARKESDQTEQKSEQNSGG